jgi:hypothetical protein
MEPLYILTQFGFVATTLFFYGLVIVQLKKALGKSSFEAYIQKRIIYAVIGYLLLWMIVLSGLSLSGFFSKFDTMPPRFVIIVLVPLITLIWVLLISKTTKQILIYIPKQAIINLQVFRVVVEILLWLLFIQNLLPIQMTFEGLNFDILAGITAPLVAYFGITKYHWPKRVLIVWNLLSLGLLINIVTIAILSFPTPFRYFMNEPANTIVAEFPFVWLPGFLVPLAYGLHFLSLRQLISHKS